MRLKDTGEEGRDGEEELSNRHHPDQIGHKIKFFRGKVGNDAGERTSEYGHQGRENEEYEADGGESRVGQVIGFFFRLLGIFLVYGNEGGGDGANDQELKNGVRDDKSGEVDIQVAFEPAKETGSQKVIPY